MICGILIPVLGCEVISVPSEPPNEIVASPVAQALYEAATPYIGSVPAVSNILNILRENDIMPQDAGTLELQTDEQPYGMIIHFIEMPEDEEELCNKMYDTGLLLWALVENLENVEWTFPSEEDGKEILVTYYLDRNAVSSAYGGLENIKEYGKSAEKVEELMRMVGIVIERIPEIKNLSH